MRKAIPRAWRVLSVPSLLTLLASPFAAQALQTVDGSDGATIAATLSVQEPTRIRVEGARITNVFGNIHLNQCGAQADTALPPAARTGPAPGAAAGANPAGEVDLECDVEKGEIYVRPVGAGNKPVNLFVSTAHATYTLLLRRLDTPADTIVIRDKSQPAQRAVHKSRLADPSPPYVRALKSLVVAMAAQRVPLDFQVQELNRPMQLWGEADFTLVRTYEGRGLVGEHYVLTNVSNSDMVVTEHEFDRENAEVLAVSVEHHNLLPGQSTAVYVVRRGS